jgi:RHS repeat-associated protein
MGCLKLTYYPETSPLKVVKDFSFSVEKSGVGAYRYGFNGQERETELDESTTSAEYWMYDGRLGRRWNVDPVVVSIPFISPYACFNNNPIWFIDINGDSAQSITTDEPKITFASGVDSKVVSQYSLDVIKDILQEAGLNSATITSTYRAPKRQIDAMYTNLVVEGGIQTQKDLYGKKGDQVIDAFIEASGKSGATPESIKAAMLAKAVEVGFVSNHSSEDYAKYNVIDISYKSLTTSQYKALKQAALADPRIKIVLGKEEGDKALHLEIPVLNNVTPAPITQPQAPTFEGDNTVVNRNIIPPTQVFPDNGGGVYPSELYVKP